MQHRQTLAHHFRIASIRCRLLCVVTLLAVATGCTAPVRRGSVPVFFPPGPELPRIQYLTSFSGLKDIEAQSAFDRFVVGEQQDVKIDKPYGVAVHEGKVYVCDTNATVAVIDLENKTFRPLPGATAAGQLSQPINISIDDGTRYVADPVRGQVVAYGPDDQYLRAYGSPGGWRPVDAVGLDDRLYVADIANGLVKVFDKQSGEILETIGDKGNPSERLDRPSNLAFDHEGDLYVTDVGRFQVVKLDRDGHFKSTFGKAGDNPGHFARPKGIALDREGRLHVVDASFNNIQVFSKEGRLLLFYGGSGDQPGTLLLPAKVTIDYDNLDYFTPYAEATFEIEYLIFVTNQFGPRRVSVFGFGHQKGKQYPSDAELLKRIEERRSRELKKSATP